MRNDIKVKGCYKLLKKITYVFLGSILFLTIPNIVEAKSNSREELQQQIDDKIEFYLKQKNRSTMEELSYDETVEIVNQIEELKLSMTPKTRAMDYTWDELNGGVNLSGYLFLSLDSHISSFHYGHAGIGAGNKGQIIEAMPDVGVKLYENRASWWNRSDTGGMYSVDASPSQYITAKNYAVKQIGKGYSLLPTSGTFYCSELVYYAWKDAGVNVASSRTVGTLILPAQIIADADTTMVKKFEGKK